MLNRTRVWLPALALLLAGFGAGVVRLVRLRFEAGDVYPPYSSFRADPLGAKALFESLADLPGVSARRHLQQVARLPEGRDTTLLLFGADLQGLEAVPESEFTQLDQFLRQGGRIVVTFSPTGTKPSLAPYPRPSANKKKPEARQSSPHGKDNAGGGKDPASEEKLDEAKVDRTRRPGRRIPLGDEDEEAAGKFVSLHEKWGVAFDYAALPTDDTGQYRSVAAQATEGGNLPPTLTWHTALCFDKLSTNWAPRYTRDGRPVFIEQSVGPGSLVLAADSYFVSNEALRKERQPGLLAWLVGSNRNVLFDEAHLGVTEAPGIAALVRQYHLQGLAASLVLLAGLFIWKNGVRFVPAPEDEAGGAGADEVAGRDSAAGFVNLLRRSIPPGEIVAVCLNEWEKSGGRGCAALTAQAGEIATGAETGSGRARRDRDPVASYRRVATFLRSRSGREAGTRNAEARRGA
jgi:hypothetical protein